MVNGTLDEVVGFGLIHPLRKVVHMVHVGNFPIILFCLSGRGGKTFGGPVVLLRHGVTEGLVNAVVVVVVHPPGNGGLQLVEVVVGAEVDQLAFKRAPQMNSPLLTVAIPTKDRPEWCLRALKSILRASIQQNAVQILISDNSHDNRTEQILAPYLSSQTVYWRNRPITCMVNNWNLLLREAAGSYILWLHDDDFLLPGGLSTILQTLNDTPSCAFHVFSAKTVDHNEKTLFRAGAHREKIFDPSSALLALFTHSSFIRFPSAVVSTTVAKNGGGFDASQGDTADLCMWARLASTAGLATHKALVVAYTVHTAQTTSRMFNAATLRQISDLAAPYESIIGTDKLAKALSKCFWRFVIGGSIRAIKKSDFKEAKRIMHLTTTEMFQTKSCPIQWLPLRLMLTFIAKFSN